MNCKKCGFNMNDTDKKCPFCGFDNDESDVSFKVYSKVESNEKKEEKPQQYQKIDNKTAESFRNQNGYIQINIHSMLFFAIGCLSYGLMEVFSVLLYKIFLSIYKSKGIDFGCLVDGSTCAKEVTLAYSTCSSLAQIITELVLIGIVAFLFRRKLKLFFNELKDKKTYKWFGICLAIMYGATIVYSMFLQQMGVTSTSTNQESVNELILNKPLLGFIFVAIAAPLFEEIIFRFGIYRSFVNGSKTKEVTGLIITTVAFAMLHMVATFLEAAVDPTNINYELIVNDLWFLPSYLIGAFGLTFAYYKSKNLATSMLTHIAWNTFSFVSIFIVDLIPGADQAIIHFFG